MGRAARTFSLSHFDRLVVAGLSARAARRGVGQDAPGQAGFAVCSARLRKRAGGTLTEPENLLQRSQARASNR